MKTGFEKVKKSEIELLHDFPFGLELKLKMNWRNWFKLSGSFLFEL